MDSARINTLSLCSGVGMLDEGARLAFQYLGIESRTVAYAEWEAYPAAQLVALMENGALDPAPVWCGDMRELDAGAFRGLVDCVIAGFPCQDISIAGRRAGLDGDRSGLFFSVCDIADDCGARLLILENVSAITTATASVVDPTEGDLEERAVSRVVGELADRGWNAEWLHIRASDVGASHQRERWFLFGWRELADTEHPERREGGASGVGGQQRANRDGREADCRAGVSGSVLADTGRERRQQIAGSASENESQNEGRPAQHDHLPAGKSKGMGNTRHEHSDVFKRQIRPEPSRAGGAMANAESQPRPGCEVGTEKKIPLTSCNGGNVADTSEQGCKRSKQRRARTCDRAGQEAHGSVSELCGAFAPGPADERWQGILEQYPGLTPATESGVCLSADGLALVVDESRADQLRATGNGVVPLQAARAVVELVRRSGTRR